LDLESYFRRIGYTGSRAPTLDTLRALHLRHPLAIPFETLDPLLGRPVRLDRDALQQKLIAERRGGYCFEQNLLFGHVLAELGFRATNLAARVIWERGDDGRRPRTHMLLFVQLGEGGYLCDVGFGGLTITAPLRLEPDVEQTTPHEPMRVLRDNREFTVQARLRGEWRSLYRFDLQEQREVDIEVLNHYVSTHPDSPFLTTLMAALTAEDRRHALRDNRYRVHYRDGRTEERRLATPTELRATLERTFGIDLPAGAALDRALERLID
jgi:N-hydroxyarylamine O-acetyltransferase